MDILAELNPAQRKAAEAIDGPLLILAGPGSGKTRVITHRIAYLTKVCGVSPRRIMAVTFTNKAAREMEERLTRLAAGAVKEMTMGTFHAICVRILRQDGRTIGVQPSFVIYDRDDQLSLIKRCLKEMGLDPKQHVPAAVLSAISNAKSQVTTPLQYSQRARGYFEETVARIYETYQKSLQQNNAVDFDDLLMKTVQLFESHPEILEKYQQRYLHIMVDEFQDTNLVQYRLVEQLAGAYRNICVVGDPDQSIYSWRSADMRNILNFEKDYPEAKVILLEQNYRSTKTILQTASGIINANKQRKPTELWTENEQGEMVSIIETYNQQEEAQFVVREVERLLEKGKASLSDCAVMYRTNAQSRALEETFIRYGTPYKLVSGTRFYERREVKDIIAYLKLIYNPRDGVSLLRIINVPPRGIGERTLSQLAGWANSMKLSQYQALKILASEEGESQPMFNPRMQRLLADFYNKIEDLIERSQKDRLANLFDLLLKKIGYRESLMSMVDGEDRWENLMELRAAVKQYSDLDTREGLAAFLEGVTLVSDVDSYDEKVGAVTLITLHQAKGLEFPVVFMVGMEEGVLPHIRSFDDPMQMEEERRLCYVGVTRARQRLYLVRAFRRNMMGGSTVNAASRFLKDIPAALVAGSDVWRGEESQIRQSETRWESNEPAIEIELPELKAGDRVLHKQFGKGTVVSCRESDGDFEVVVAFPGMGVKKLLLSFAHLEKVE
ncbi:ATP-dependent helicase [Chloroflexota bacterium]